MIATYPTTAGFKDHETETSRAAAEAITGAAVTLRARCLAAVTKRPMTADEVAAELGVDRLAIRPRLSELKVLRRVEKTEGRRCNVSGKTAVVWRTAGPLGQLELGT